jgi:YHS domain-containing protein
MQTNRISFLERRVKQKADIKSFNRKIRIVFFVGLLVTILILVFYTYWHDTRFYYREYAMYGKQISGELICFHENTLQHFKGQKTVYKGKDYYFCSAGCANHYMDYLEEHSHVNDAFSGEEIHKEDAILGLKYKGKSEIAYFKNLKNFIAYYNQIIP